MYKFLLLASVLVHMSFAAPITLWVDDANGRIGKVDVTTGAATIVGDAGVILDDIAFAPDGGLYGIGKGNFYSVNTDTGAASLIGSLGPNLEDANSLVFASDGTLYTANFQLLTINRQTGRASYIGAIDFGSGGDLAFVNGSLYLSNLRNELVKVDQNTGLGTLLGGFVLNRVDGLASPDNRILYGIGGNTIYTIDPETTAVSNPVSFAGQGLSDVLGEAFPTEALSPSGAPGATPEPASAALMGMAIAVGLLGFRRKSKFHQPPWTEMVYAASSDRNNQRTRTVSSRVSE